MCVSLSFSNSLSLSLSVFVLILSLSLSLYLTRSVCLCLILSVFISLGTIHFESQMIDIEEAYREASLGKVLYLICFHYSTQMQGTLSYLTLLAILISFLTFYCMLFYCDARHCTEIQCTVSSCTASSIMWHCYDWIFLTLSVLISVVTANNRLFLSLYSGIPATRPVIEMTIPTSVDKTIAPEGR